MSIWIEICIQFFKMYLLSCISISIVLFFRALMKERLWSNGRMILWYVVIFFMIVPLSSQFTTTYTVGNSFIFPPIDIILNIDGASFRNKIHGLLELWNGSSYYTLYFNGKIALVLMTVLWLVGSLLLLNYLLYNYVKLRINIRKSPEDFKDEWVGAFINSDLQYWRVQKEISFKIIRKEYLNIHCPILIGNSKPMIVIPYEQWII